LVGIGFVALGAIALASTAFLYWEERVGSICGDGWISESINSGRCSSHGGVDEDLSVNTLVGVTPDNPINIPRLGVGLFGVVDLAIGGFLLDRARRRRPEATLPTPTPAPAATRSESASGIVELTARFVSGQSGPSVEISTDGGEPTVQPFTFRNDNDRAALQLTELSQTTKKRRFGRRGRTAVEAFGAELFDALFVGNAHTRYREALTAAVGANSRLRVLLELDDATQGLPWEYLYDSERASFLAMSGDTTVVRVVRDQAPTRPSAPIDQLRVLVMAASPRGFETLDIDAELRQIKDRLAGCADRVAVQFVDGETLDDLRTALTTFDPHVFHFIGHGQWDDSDRDGAVVFSDRHGGPHPITGRDLGVLLNRPGLRLVLFNSCNGARTSQHDRFAGVAGSLVAQGVPASIGMQYPVEDQSAASFGSEFLAALIATGSIDQALTDARTKIYASHSGIEWATPVMTTRVDVDAIIEFASTTSRAR